MPAMSSLRSLVFSTLTLLSATACVATTWFPFGPEGGDARAFAADPHDQDHIFLGTAVGWIYDSHDGGKSWKRLARVGNRDDLVIDNIVVDPADSKHVLVGTWVLGKPDGGLFVSTDGGNKWSSNPEMKGESIRALTAAPSDSKIVVAGTLKGIFRSNDGGTHWKLISPVSSTEIHEVESIAIDPNNPQTIYAGTWHLPWKTTDGGATWNNIKQGIIEDSDVFSIIVDPKQPSTMYLSACSGIYKSDDAGGKFAKIQGIPATARRTRVLMQDPGHRDTVFAGTTEGLYHTDDAGAHWSRFTSGDLIINDVYVDPRSSKHVMLATDRGGVLTSNDGGVSFVPTNTGYSTREVTSVVSDPQQPSHVYLGVANDKQWGGAFFSTDGGLSWTQHELGLEGHDVFSLGIAANGTVVAGTEHGLYAYNSAAQSWSRVGDIMPPPRPEKPVVRGRKHPEAHPVAVRKPVELKPTSKVEIGVSTITRIGDELYAVTTEGVYEVEDPLKPWRRVEGPASEPWRYMAGSKSVELISSLKALSLSIDSGKTWHEISLPPAITQIGAVSVDDSGELWVGGRGGLYYSADQGASWGTMKNLFVNDVNNIYYDEAGQRLLVTSNALAEFAYAFHIPDRTLKYWDTGWDLRLLRPVGDYLLAATLFDGVVLQPRMVEAKAALTK